MSEFFSSLTPFTQTVIAVGDGFEPPRGG